ncbi:disease resistance protein RPS6-like [Jatropha curcas]|uniref:disease resistance protein RPS6-like n=1 Tax=Jatropha curcas TaxID=180498 RepID=UPI0018952C76|nr:disease resistance protein RPS6-like [Jatropha curcas]
MYSKALFFIQQIVHEIIFSRIAAATTSKRVWTTLQTEFQGQSKLSNSREGPNSIVLRGLTPKFDHVVAAIEEFEDLSAFSFDEKHEERMNRITEKHEEKAFPGKGCAPQLNLVRQQEEDDAVMFSWKRRSWAKVMTNDITMSRKIIQRYLQKKKKKKKKYLETLPDLSSAPNLERILLSNCKTLSQIPLSIQCLHNLVSLNLRGCEKLRSLPRLAQLGSLRILFLKGCSNLQMLVDIPRGLKILVLGECGLEEWFQEDGLVCNLQVIDVQNCKNLRSLPSGDFLNSIKELSLKGCSSLSKLPENIGNNITKLDLSYTMIEDLSSTILRLSSLYHLDMQGCKRLKSLSSSICQLKSLKIVNLRDCSKLGKLPDLHGLCSLRELRLDTALHL